MKKPIISFQDVSFQYQSQSEPTLHHLSFDIYPGEKVLIAGASGSGKTTISRLMNGLIPSAYPGELSGKIFINGESVTDQTIFDLSLRVGTVLQDPDTQFVGLTVAEDIAFALENDAEDQSVLKQKAKDWAKQLKIPAILNNHPQEISGGQKQRVSMAGVLVDEGKILLFDEPLASLDPIAGRESIELIDDMQKNGATTTVIIEHRIEDVLYRPVDRIILIDQGKLVANDTPNTILKSGILAKLGLREPLYLSALKYAGIDLTQVADVDSVGKVALSASTISALQAWVKPQQARVQTMDVKPMLQANNISFSYDSKQVLNKLNLNINAGEMVSLVGRNGVGKTTLSNIITGFLHQSSGDLVLNGHSINEASIKERADHIGYVLQDPNMMISKNTVSEEVALGLTLRAVAPDEIERRVAETLKVCGLFEFRHWPISALSFGQKKRVTIAAILVLNPELLILDEPTAGQDWQHYTEMMTFIRDLNRKIGISVIFITHDMHLMMEYTDRVVVLNNGVIAYDDQPMKLFANLDLLKQASLVETSLFTLAQRIKVDPEALIASFINQEKVVQTNE
ncbi:ABC transporter ATP-binding protein [Pediococcus parvulus]|jgi:energy-coupling factor transporter ATP-binding protein EcfA2|uniref:ABC transporter ATP-binding protein n=1 Tax=Pediococcus parvulus TaxID=54062 RepID=UPI00070E30AB|nr:ABC transporter ATP-binding protein [Pediococcus parvulus]MCT3027662.1 ATP-binding cassette domain-containing protein [Pediococcus parvulus]GEL89778.1 putative ABC transporter ATP-binding protein [Pediococcus parvulus]GHC11328.1 putative ABC transporter ATP-binding protein [Pediococcus parvulus]